MRAIAIGAIIVLLGCGAGTAETGDAHGLYFPPTGGQWERVSPEDVGWNTEALEEALAFAGDHNSSGVVILHRGRILAEKYWELDDPPVLLGFNYRDMWLAGTTEDGRAIEDVASTQKSVISVLAGIAVDKGLLDVEDPVSKYLGEGWSSAPADAEGKILVRHLLSMSAGLTEKLEFVSPAGEKWAYINKAYSLVNDVIQAATGREPNDFTSEWLTTPLGMTETRWIVRSEFFRQWNMNGLATTARDLARFGLMVQAGGTRNGTRIVSEGFLKQALSQSHPDNPSYGFLWWLNDPKGWRWVRGENSQATASGRLIPAAPPDLVAAMGTSERKVYVTPSLGLVVTRLGSTAKLGEDRMPVAHYFNREFWSLLMKAAPE